MGAKSTFTNLQRSTHRGGYLPPYPGEERPRRRRGDHYVGKCATSRSYRGAKTTVSSDKSCSGWGCGFFSTVLRGYFTDGQCCSGTHFPLSSVAPTSTPQTSHGCTAHWTRSLLLASAACNSSLKRPSQGFTGAGINLHIVSGLSSSLWFDAGSGRDRPGVFCPITGSGPAWSCQPFKKCALACQQELGQGLVCGDWRS